VYDCPRSIEPADKNKLTVTEQRARSNPLEAPQIQPHETGGPPLPHGQSLEAKHGSVARAPTGSIEPRRDNNARSARGRLKKDPMATHENWGARHYEKPPLRPRREDTEQDSNRSSATEDLRARACLP
jgi:hypothetical protein